MSATQESGAYLGGIGVMLEVSHPCPACGQVHDGRKFGLKHRSPRECPRVVMGSFPLVSLPSPPDEILSTRAVGAASRSRGSPALEDPTPLLADRLTLLRPNNEPARGRALGVPWLPPPDLGEVL